jgi:hypothetical protein
VAVRSHLVTLLQEEPIMPTAETILAAYRARLPVAVIAEADAVEAEARALIPAVRALVAHATRVAEADAAICSSICDEYVRDDADGEWDVLEALHGERNPLHAMYATIRYLIELLDEV